MEMKFFNWFRILPKMGAYVKRVINLQVLLREIKFFRS